MAIKIISGRMSEILNVLLGHVSKDHRESETDINEMLSQLLLLDCGVHTYTPFIDVRIFSYYLCRSNSSSRSACAGLRL